MFDWENFLDQRGISYVTSGPNVSRGNIGIKCPFCGQADPSEHMAISVDGRGWVCRRDRSHHGKNPARLIAAILGCSLQKAHELVGDTTYVPEDFYSQVMNLIEPKERTNPDIQLQLPPEFKAFGERRWSETPYQRYLIGRGFTNEQIENFTMTYDMYYASQGKFMGRVIFTVWFDGRLMTWTGRSIYKDQMRYLSLSVNDCGVAINDYLLWYDDILEFRGDTIVLVEGPFDALKVRELGERHGITATCVFTSAPTERQIGLLYELLPRFKNRFVLLDHGTEATALRLQSELTLLSITPKYMPNPGSDPGSIKNFAELRSILFYP